jgi:phage shock protein A
MAESLSARVGRVIAGSVHALLDRIEDAAPEAAMEQALREVDKVVDEVRHELGTVAANRHLAQQQHAALNRQHTQLAEQIEQAIDQAREDLARAGVARQLDIEAQIPVLEKSLAELAGNETELTGYVNALLAKRREMTAALENFRAARKVAAGSLPHAAAARASESRMETASNAFDRVYQRHTGLSPGAAGASLEQAARLKDLDDMVRNNQIDERLAKLKAAQP